MEKHKKGGKTQWLAKEQSWRDGAEPCECGIKWKLEVPERSHRNAEGTFWAPWPCTQPLSSSQRSWNEARLVLVDIRRLTVANTRQRRGLSEVQLAPKPLFSLWSISSTFYPSNDLELSENKFVSQVVLGVKLGRGAHDSALQMQCGVID